jgi:hypothetical protein
MIDKLAMLAGKPANPPFEPTVLSGRLFDVEAAQCCVTPKLEPFGRGNTVGRNLKA